MSRWVPFLVVVFAGTFACSMACAGESKKPVPKKKAGETVDAKKKVRWAVIQIDDEMKVVKQDEVLEIRKEILKENKEAAKDKTAKGKKAPKKVLKVLRMNFPDREAAEKYLDELKEKKAGKSGKAGKGDKAVKGKAAKALKSGKEKTGKAEEEDEEGE